jgi:hypothetical protein
VLVDQVQGVAGELDAAAGLALDEVGVLATYISIFSSVVCAHARNTGREGRQGAGELTDDLPDQVRRNLRGGHCDGCMVEIRIALNLNPRYFVVRKLVLYGGQRFLHTFAQSARDCGIRLGFRKRR